MNTDSPSNFRVALDSNFRDVNGNALYPDFDLTPLNQEAELSWNYGDLGEVVSGDTLLDYDALVLLLPRFTGNRFLLTENLLWWPVLESGMTPWIRGYAIKTGSY